MLIKSLNVCCPDELEESAVAVHSTPREERCYVAKLLTTIYILKGYEEGPLEGTLYLIPLYNPYIIYIYIYIYICYPPPPPRVIHAFLWFSTLFVVASQLDRSRAAVTPELPPSSNSPIPYIT